MTGPATPPGLSSRLVGEPSVTAAPADLAVPMEITASAEIPTPLQITTPPVSATPTQLVPVEQIVPTEIATPSAVVAPAGVAAPMERMSDAAAPMERAAPTGVAAPAERVADVAAPAERVAPEHVAVLVEIVALFTSPLHAYEGRPADGPLPDPDGGGRERIELRAGLGVVGDRYFNQAAHRTASVTLMAAESLDAVAAELGIAGIDPLLPRRTVVLRGVDVDALAATRERSGAELSLDSGDGPVRLRAHRPANPCAWMDAVIAPGAFRALRRRGGVRCEPLTDGVLRVGPATLTVHPSGS